MRPDEDYEDADDNARVGNSRAMSWMVLAVAVGGFAALAYYAYHSGAQAPTDGDTTVIEADGTPIKSAPENADGEQFANKDKTIYDVIAPDGSPAVEKLMPDPERPVAAANVEDSEDAAPVATTPAAALAAVAQPAPVNAPTTFVAAEQAAPKMVTPEAAPVATKKVSEPVVAAPVTTEVAAAAPVEKSFAAPEMINEKKPDPAKEDAPAKAEKPEAKPAEKPLAKPVEKAAPKPAAAKATGGAYMVQLGAFKSEGEAQAAWKKISGSHGDVLRGAPTIVKAEVNGGIFYRLRAGSYADAAAAKAVCAKLAGQACMPVK